MNILNDDITDIDVIVTTRNCNLANSVLELRKQGALMIVGLKTKWWTPDGDLDTVTLNIQFPSPLTSEFTDGDLVEGLERVIKTVRIVYDLVASYGLTNGKDKTSVSLPQKYWTKEVTKIVKEYKRRKPSR